MGVWDNSHHSYANGKVRYEWSHHCNIFDITDVGMRLWVSSGVPTIGTEGSIPSPHVPTIGLAVQTTTIGVTMSNVTTLPTLPQIMAASKASGVSIADLIVAINDGLNTPTVVKPSKPAQTNPRTKARTRTRKAADKADSPILVSTKNGGMMDSRPGTATKGQLAKIQTLCDSKGYERHTDAEMATLATYSMAAMSDYRTDLIAEFNA